MISLTSSWLNNVDVVERNLMKDWMHLLMCSLLGCRGSLIGKTAYGDGRQAADVSPNESFKNFLGPLKPVIGLASSDAQVSVSKR